MNSTRLLLGPVEPLIKDKRHLLVVPSGALTALPFHLLVTEKPAVAVPDRKDLRPYREAAWLLKRQAVSVLPSVASLKGLRAFAGHQKAPKPMIGFGDPVFHPEQQVARVALNRGARKTRAYTEHWRGAGIDRDRLGQLLAPLPDTADELKAIAIKLGATMSDLHLRERANEAGGQARCAGQLSDRLFRDPRSRGG